MNKLTIYFTSDTHGYLYPTNFADKQARPMGLLSMRFPKDENTLVIDGGDTIQGSPLTYYCKTQDISLPVAEAMNDRGYDYITLGNHDFNNGYAYLEKYLNALDAQCLCANVSDKTGALPILPATVHTLGNGLRVGLVGLVTDWIKLWEKMENLIHFDISDPLAAAKHAIEALECDVLVGIYHGGFEKELTTGRPLSGTNENIACRLCEELPFDLLLTGHQHIPLSGACWNGVYMVQPPCNAAAYVKITMDEEKHFSSELIAPPAQAELTPAQETLWQALDFWLDTPIGRLSKPLLPMEKLEMALCGSSIADFFNRVQLWASGADISCTALGNEVRGFDSAVTVRDVVASYVYSNTLVVLRVSGSILRQALEQCARYFDVNEQGKVSIARSFLEPKVAHYDYDYFAGVDYTFDLNRPAGDRLVSLTKNGAPVRDEEEFTLCLCDYRSTGAGNFPFYASCPHVREIQTEVSELILSYLSAHSEVTIPDAHPIRCILPKEK